MELHDRFIKLVKKRGKVFLLLLVALNITAFIGLFSISINTDFDLFMPDDSTAMEQYKEMTSKFGSAEQLIFLVKSDKTDKTEVLKQFFEIQKSLDIKGVKFVNGPVPPAIPSGFGAEEIAEINEENTPRIFEYIDNMGSVKTLYRKDSAYYGYFTITSEQGESLQTAERVLSVFQKSGLDFYKTGDVYLQTSIFDYVQNIILFLLPLEFGLILLVFRWRIGNLKGTMMSVLPAGLGALWTMGLLGWLSYELSVISVLAPIFTVVMGSADGLHFISHVQDEIKAGKSREKALSSTLAKVGKPMIMTTLTTVAGFLSLLVVNSEPMRQLAISASIGITFAGVATWVFLPVVCMFIKNPGMTKTGPGLDPITPLFGKTIGRSSVIITLIISIVFLPGIFLIQTDLNMINLYKKSTRVRRSIEKITDITGGAIPVFIEFTSEQDPLSPAVADKVLSMEERLLESKSVTKTISLFNIFSTLNRSVFGAEKKAYPDKLARANLMFTIFQQNQPEQVKNTLLRESKTGRLVVFPRSLSNKDLQQIQDIAAEAGGKAVEFTVVGTPYIMKEMNERIIPDQLNSIFLAVFMVFALMWFALRSFKMAIIGVVPLATTLIALFGFMGFASIELSVITSTMASITIGVGIDYSVHFTSLFKTFLKKHDAQKAAKMSFDYVSKPVLANALGLAIGLSALLLSPLKFHMYMSLLMWVTMLVSSFVSLTFLPTLLSKVFSGKGQKR